MPYPMWIPFKRNSVSDDPKFVEELQENWLEIERWSEIGFSVGTRVPFIVVANDGTGDFATVGGAVASVTDGEQAFIWIKYTGTVYAETATIAFGTRQIVLFGGGAPYLTFGGRVRLNLSGNPDMSASSGGAISFHNLELVQLVASTWFGGSSGFSVGFYGSYSDQEINVNYSNFHVRDSAITYGATTPFFDVANSSVTFQAGSYSLRHSRISDCDIHSSGSVTFNCPGTSSGEDLIFNDNQINGGGPYVLSGWTQVDFVGNITVAEVVFGPTLSGVFTLTFSSCRNIHYSSNLWGCTVTFSATGTNNRGHITGTAYLMTIAGDGFSFNVTIEGNRGIGGTPAGPGLLVSGDFNVGTVFANNYTLGVDVTGADNLVNMTGTNNTTDIQSNGASNKLVTGVNTVINPAAPGGTDVYL